MESFESSRPLESPDPSNPPNSPNPISLPPMKSEVRVFKFGGASVCDAAAVKNAASIIKEHGERPLVVVVSAMDKMTNALERVVEAYINGSEDLHTRYEEVKKFHVDVVQDLWPAGNAVLEEMNDLFVEIDWIIEDEVHDTYAYLYDQIVSVGELLSSRILSACLADLDVHHVWHDARDLIITEDVHREARVIWSATREAISRQLTSDLETNGMVLTQGFIGSTTDNQTTTLGREGSDFTAAILANCLDASEVVLWKNVPGVMSADPARFENVEKLNRLTYREAIEMTYYGARVLHPKTIKPIQNKQIPLYVRSFDQPDAEGTWVGTELDTILPPVVIVEENQALVHIAVDDFSFVAEQHLSKVFDSFARHRIKVNLMRNSAISFMVCCNNDPAKLESFKADCSDGFTIVVDSGVKLITVRHANQQTVDALIDNAAVLFEERFKDTIQFVLKDTSTLKMK